MPARVLNERYRLDEIIGSGATATIWRAWDRRLDRAVAVKVLDGLMLRSDGDPAERNRFCDEARTLARLSHPNIVAVFDSGVDDGVSYVVMELVEGHNAIARLADGVMSTAEASSVMAQVCDALGAAHAAGVVHRDIKPGNILLGPGRTVKVCDFGIARLLDTTALTASHVAIGTSSYMSPEQVAGRILDGRADLYAVGCVLFRMLTGTPPFVGESAFNIAYQQIHTPAPTVRSRRPDISPEMDRLVSRLLAKDPTRRPSTAADVRAELMRLSEPTVFATTGTRHRRPLARMGVATIAAIAVPAAFLLAWPDGKPGQSPAAATSPSASVPATATASASASVSASPSSRVRDSASPSPAASQQPEPSPSPAARSAADLIADARALVRQLEATQQLPAPNADDLDHNLNDLNNLVAKGKQRESRDKLASIQKKIDDLMAAGKLSPAGHGQLELLLDQLAVTISAMPAL